MRVIWHSRAIEGKNKLPTTFVGSLDLSARIDPLFADRPIAYRSIIISGLSKMVYRLDNEAIHIVAFWDTRREPNAQAAKVKE